MIVNIFVELLSGTSRDVLEKVVADALNNDEVAVNFVKKHGRDLINALRSERITTIEQHEKLLQLVRGGVQPVWPQPVGLSKPSPPPYAPPRPKPVITQPPMPIPTMGPFVILPPSSASKYFIKLLALELLLVSPATSYKQERPFPYFFNYSHILANYQYCGKPLAFFIS